MSFETGSSDGRVRTTLFAVRLLPLVLQTTHGWNCYLLHRKRRNRSSASSNEKTTTSPEAKKLKDAIAHDNTDNEDDSHDELMEKLDTIASISEQLKPILDRVKKLDIIEN